MYRNKLNLKPIKNVKLTKVTAYFTIDGLETSLPIQIFRACYEEME